MGNVFGWIMRNTTSMDFDSYLMFQTFPTLGTGHGTKTDEFLEKFERGGRGVIFNPKIHYIIYIADFGTLNRAFLA